MKKIALILVVAGLSSCGRPEVKPMITGKEGKELPAFYIQLTDSISYSPVAKPSDGKTKVLFYFSTHCPYCRLETKKITENIADLKNVDFVFISDSPIKEIADFSKEYNIEKQPNIIIGRDTVNTIGGYFDIKNVPFIAVYNERKLKACYDGLIGKTQLLEIAKL